MDNQTAAYARARAAHVKAETRRKIAGKLIDACHLEILKMAGRGETCTSVRLAFRYADLDQIDAIVEHFKLLDFGVHVLGVFPKSLETNVCRQIVCDNGIVDHPAGVVAEYTFIFEW